MKQLPESLGALGVEGRVDGMRPGGAPAQRRLKTTLVEEMDGVAGALGVAAEAAGDLVGVLAPGAGEKYLAPAEDESIRRAQACLQGLALGVRDRTHEDWSSHVVEDNSSTTASSEYALGPKSWPLRHWSQRGGILQYVYFEEGKRKGTSPADY
jgi:uncharacterized protein YaiE (UPF0345 family)